MNKHITLCKPGRFPVCTLNGVDIDTVNYTQKFNDLDEITFTVDKYIEAENGERIFSAGYEILHAFMEIYVDDIGYFQIKEPEISNEINKETKTVTGVSIATELLQKDLVGFTVNTSTTSSLEMLADNNINSLGYPNEYITFYNPANKQLSLLDLVLEKAAGWNVGEVDDFLKNQRYSFENINENIFSFLTKTLSSTAKCIFKFDTMNKTVSAYSENHIGNDTGIVIAERNLLNSVDIQCDSDNIYTRLNVQGKDSLNFADINYGDTHIFNLDYYSNLDYMSQDLIDALGVWQNARNDGRDEYISKVKTYQSYLEQISEIDNKVPTNGVLNNWDNMSMDELNKNLTYYNSLIKELQIVAQNTHPKTGETEYVGSLDDYSPSRLKSDGTVDHDSYMNDLDGQGKETYREVITYVIPNIKIAIENFDLTKDDKKDYFEDYLTDWDLYGLVELKAKRSSYEDQIGTLKAYQKGWNELTEEEKASHGDNEATYTRYHEEYEKLDGYLAAIKNKTTELQEQKDNLVKGRDTLSKELSTIRSDMGIDGGRDVNGSFVKWFTEEQLSTISLLFHDTDYTNENILTTKLNDFSSKLDIEKELYADAEKELSELSVPQYTFNCSLDNLLSMDEFSFWHNDFEVGNFITLEINKGSFSSYKIDGIFIKLRLISISYNPFIKTNDLTVEFSNMITGKDGRNDFSYIFDKAISAAKNSITLSNNNDAKDDIELSIELLNLLSNSSVFQGKFDNLNLKSAVINEAAIVKLTADFAKITELDAKYATIENLSATNATITELNANVANIEKAYIKKIEADKIYAKTAEVNTLLAGYVKSDVASIGTLFNKVGLIDRATIVDGHITGFLDAVEINADNITAGTLVADRILLKAPDGSNQKGLLYAINKFGNVESTSVDTIDGNILTDRTITADKLIANSITANELDVTNIFGNKAVLTTLVSQDIFANAVSTNSLVVSANENAAKALNIQIGGRNLLYYSHFDKKYPNAWAYSAVVTYAFDSNAATFTKAETTTRQFTTQASVSNGGVAANPNLLPENGCTYTISCEVMKAEGYDVGNGTKITTRYNFTDGTVKDFDVDVSGASETVWTKYSHTYTYASDKTVSYTQFIIALGAKACGIRIKNVKFEKGNKPTDWTPAPEDVDSAISEASIRNWCYDNDTTYIDGGKIYAKTITTDQLMVDSLSAINTNLGTVNAGTIQSYNYEENSTGMKLSLSDGSWDSKYFKIDSNGKIDAKEGIIAGWNMISDCLYKEIKQSDGSTSLDRCVYINTKLSYGEPTEADGTVTTYQRPKGKIIGINASLNDRNDSNTHSYGATYIGVDGSIYSSSTDGENSFHLYDGYVDLLQTKELSAQSGYSYMCRCSGNNIRFARVNTGDKPQKTGYLYVGELGNETAGTLGIKGNAKGLFSDSDEDSIYIATPSVLCLKANSITASAISAPSFTGVHTYNGDSSAWSFNNIKSNFTKGTTPTATQYWDVNFLDANGTGHANRIGYIESKVDSAGASTISLITMKNEAGGTSSSSLSIAVNTDGSEVIKLGTKAIGNSHTPIYLNNGVVTKCSSMLPLTGGTMSGDVWNTRGSAINAYFYARRTDLNFSKTNSDGTVAETDERISFGIASSGARGIYDNRANKWLMYCPASSTTTYINGDITRGAVSTVTGTILTTATIAYKKDRNRVLLIVRDNSMSNSGFAIIPVSSKMSATSGTVLNIGSESISYSVATNGSITIRLSNQSKLAGSTYVALFYSEA